MKRGFTLIELVAVLALMGILTTTVIMNVGGLEVSRLKTDASRLAAAVRYLHNLAVMNNGYYRLVLDLGTGKYGGEELKPSQKGCSVFARSDEDDEREAKESKKAGRKGGVSGAGDQPAVSSVGDDLGPGPEGSAPPPEAASDKDKDKDKDKPKPGGGKAKATGELRRKANLMKHLELGKGVHFDGVASQFRKELQTEGKASVMFFPDGTIERALIYVANDEETWTVVTEPAMGVARVYHEKRDENVLTVEHD